MDDQGEGYGEDGKSTAPTGGYIVGFEEKVRREGANRKRLALSCKFGEEEGEPGDKQGVNLMFSTKVVKV